MSRGRRRLAALGPLLLPCALTLGCGNGRGRPPASEGAWEPGSDAVEPPSTDAEATAPDLEQTPLPPEPAPNDAGMEGVQPTPTPWRWTLPSYVTPPEARWAEPMTEELVALGRRLFNEPRLSLSGTISCASCHDRTRGYAVAERMHLGATGQRTARNAQGLANVVFASYLTWSNLTLLDLEQQTLNPLFGDSPVELGAGFVAGSDVQGNTVRLARLVADDPDYAGLFEAAFPAAGVPPTWQQAIAAITAFERTLTSFGAPYDGFLAGDPAALSPEAERGRVLFFSDRLACGSCHRGPLLSAAFPADGVRPSRAEAFANNGLYNLAEGPVVYLSGARTRYPAPSIGIGEFTQSADDDGKFRIPSLRNVAVTAPYMHDGSLPSLDAVLDHYARGGTLTTEGPNAGDGAGHPAKDARVSGFALGADERSDLLAFLAALTDPAFAGGE